MRLAWSWRLVLPLVLLAGAATCYGATEIHVSLSTDACQRNPHVAIYAGADVTSALATAPVAVSNAACDGNAGLGDLVLVPSGEKNEHIVIVVLASFDGTDPTTTCQDGRGNCVVARRSVRYSRHQSLQLPVLLSERCLNVSCPKEQTCVAGQCESAEVDQNPRLAEPNPPPSGPPPLDGSDPSDASVLDSAMGVCEWGDRSHALMMAPRPVGGISANSSSLYWVAAGGQVVRVLKNGSGVLSAVDTDLPTSIVVDDGAKYFGTTKALLWKRLKFDGGPEYIDAGVLSLALNGSSVYAATAASILRVAKAGAWLLPDAGISATPLGGPQSIAAGGSNVYWIEADHVSSIAANLSGQAVKDTLVGTPIAIAADATGAVIALSPKPPGGGGVVRYQSRQFTTLVDDPGITDDVLAIDGTATYYTRKIVTGVELWRLENGMSTKLDEPAAIRGLVFDEHCIYYWAGSSTAATVGSIMKRSKL